MKIIIIVTISLVVQVASPFEFEPNSYELGFTPAEPFNFNEESQSIGMSHMPKEERDECDNNFLTKSLDKNGITQIADALGEKEKNNGSNLEDFEEFKGALDRKTCGIVHNGNAQEEIESYCKCINTESKKEKEENITDEMIKKVTKNYKIARATALLNLSKMPKQNLLDKLESSDMNQQCSGLLPGIKKSINSEKFSSFEQRTNSEFYLSEDYIEQNICQKSLIQREDSKENLMWTEIQNQSLTFMDQENLPDEYPLIAANYFCQMDMRIKGTTNLEKRMLDIFSPDFNKKDMVTLEQFSKMVKAQPNKVFSRLTDLPENKDSKDTSIDKVEENKKETKKEVINHPSTSIPPKKVETIQGYENQRIPTTRSYAKNKKIVPTPTSIPSKDKKTQEHFMPNLSGLRSDIETSKTTKRENPLEKSVNESKSNTNSKEIQNNITPQQDTKNPINQTNSSSSINSKSTNFKTNRAAPSIAPTPNSHATAPSSETEQTKNTTVWGMKDAKKVENRNSESQLSVSDDAKKENNKDLGKNQENGNSIKLGRKIKKGDELSKEFLPKSLLSKLFRTGAAEVRIDGIDAILKLVDNKIVIFSIRKELKLL